MVQETWDEDRDGSRIARQRARIWKQMFSGNWKTIYELSVATGDPHQSVSARLRDLRKTKYGAHTVDRRYQAEGVWEYRLTVNNQRELDV
jgi:hypothetical protein